MGAYLPGFVEEVRKEFWEREVAGGGDPNDLLNAAGTVLDRHPDTMVVRLLWDIYFNLRMDDPEITQDEVEVPGDPQTIMQDLVLAVTRKILRDEDRPEDWETLEERDGPTAKEDNRRRALREHRS